MSKQPMKRLENQPVRFTPRLSGPNYSGNSKPTSSLAKKVAEAQKKLPECKICKTLQKPGDLAKVLNQGLYHKYTASLDFFYTRDINALLKKGKSPQYIRYKDDRFFDIDQEFLKYYYTSSDSTELMSEIKNFYSQFHDYPRFFDQPHYNIISSYIRKHRKIEYIQVFKPSPEEMPPRDSITENTNANQTQNKSANEPFNLLEQLDTQTIQSFSKIKESAEDNWNIDRVVFNKKFNDSVLDIEKNFIKLKEIAKKEQSKPVPQLIGPLQLDSVIIKSNNDSGIVTDLVGEMSKPTNPKFEFPQTLAEKVMSENRTPIKRISIKKLNIRMSTEPNEAPLSTNRYKYIHTAHSERKVPQIRLQQNTPNYADEPSLERLIGATTRRGGESSPSAQYGPPSKNKFFIKSPSKPDNSPQAKTTHSRQFTLPLNPYGFDSPTKDIHEISGPGHFKAATLKLDRHDSAKNHVNSPASEEKDGSHFLKKEFQIRRNYLRSSSKINGSNNIVAPFSSPTSGMSPTPEKYYLRSSKRGGESTDRGVFFKDLQIQDTGSLSNDIGRSRIKLINTGSISTNANSGIGIKSLVVPKRNRSKGTGSTTARTETSTDGNLRIVLNPSTLNNIKSQSILTHRPGISGGFNTAIRTSKASQKIVIAGNHNVNNIFIFEQSTDRSGSTTVRANKSPSLKKSYGLPAKGSPVMIRKKF